MKLLADAVALLVRGEPLALATVVAASGSTPRHVGAKMAVRSDGEILGTIGGGRIELEVTAAAIEVARGAPARRVRHHLVRDLAMCCGGSMEVYIEPLGQSREALERALAMRAGRRPAELVTPLDGGAKQVIERAAHGSRVARIEAGSHGTGERFVEAVWPSDRVLLFGCGHVGREIGALAARCGFEVVLCDDGETGALAEPPAWAAQIVESFEVRDIERALGPIGAGDHALIVTRDHAVDQRILETLLPRLELTYLGMIGSLGKVGRFRKRLEAKGLVTEERWGRLHAPVGLDIGAETPEEIAIAIVAELIAVRRRGAR
jgi:xanthine dehydrogenase accessory factor